MLALFHLLKGSVSPNTSQVNSKSPGKYPDFISSSSSVRKFNSEQTKSKDILNLPNSEKTQYKKVGFFSKTMLLCGLAGYLIFSSYHSGKVFTFERESTPGFIKIIWAPLVGALLSCFFPTNAFLHLFQDWASLPLHLKTEQYKPPNSQF